MRPTFPLALALLAVTSPLRAQINLNNDVVVSSQPPASAANAAPAPIPHGRITGTVFCADTHAPARGATVMLSGLRGKGGGNPAPMGQNVTHVSVNGTYAFNHLAPGDYAVVALFQGYLSAFDNIPPDIMNDPSNAEAEMVKIFAARGIASVAPEGSASYDIVLERGAALSGRVLYADGAPAAQISVIPQDAATSAKPSARNVPFDPMIMMKTLFTRSSFTTDDLGRFRLAGLKPGVYRVVVTEPANSGGSFNDDGMAMFSGLVGEPGGLHFYSGDTFHQKSAKTFTLTAGDELSGIDIRLPIDGFHTVTGLLTAKDGRPINMGSLTLTDTADEAFIFSAAPDIDGGFRFTSVPPGTYTLSARDAQIGAQPPGTPPGVPANQGLAPTNAFADASSSVIVKETDLSGVALTLTEIPLPKSSDSNTPSSVLPNPIPDPNN